MIGKWLLFADSDDLFVEDGFINLLDDVENMADNDIIFFPPISVDEVTGLKGVRHKAYENMVVYYNQTGDEDCLRYGWSPPWSKLIKAELVKKNKIRFRSQGAANDVIFSVLCGVYANKVNVLDYAIYIVRKRSGSITYRLTSAKTYDRLRALVERNDVLLGVKKYSALNYGVRYFIFSFSLKNFFGEVHFLYLRQLPSVFIRKFLSIIRTGD